MADSLLPPGNLFAELPTELSRGLFENARSIVLAADQMLFLAGDAGDACYRVEDGLLKASVIAREGGERILAIFGPDSLVGEDAPVGLCRGATATDTEPRQPRSFAQSNPELCRHVMRLLAHRLRETNLALAAASFLPQKGRGARVLLSLAEAFGDDLGDGRIRVRQKVTQSDLAGMAGLARENVNRILKDWTDRSLVSRLAGYYCLENKAAIEREVDL